MQPHHSTKTTYPHELPWSQALFTKAWDFATLAHQGQYYASPISGVKLDYINHVGAVAMELMWVLAKQQNQAINGDFLLQCALLHDVIEDTSYGYAEIQATFGSAVADGVLALSKQKNLPVEEQMLDSLQRIQQQPYEVWMVKLADRTNNLSEPPAHWTQAKVEAYWQESKLIYAQLHDANTLLAQRLQAQIDAYPTYFKNA